MSAADNFSLKGKNVFITGASRGIGLAIAIKLAAQGANVAIAAKTAEPNPKLKGTIYTAAKDIEAAGGKALPIICDIRFEDQVYAAIEKTVQTFGGLDILINNASAISLTTTENTSVKKFDLMNQINGRGTWLTSKAAIPHLKKSAAAGRNPHILTLSPPLDMRPHWFEGHVAYSMAKYSMSLCTLGLAGELRDAGIAVNSLWPLTAIDTAAMSNVITPGVAAEIGDPTLDPKMRTAEIMADAAFAILSQDSTKYTGQFTIDEYVLRYQGVTNFDKYKTHADSSDDELTPDFFLPDNPYDFLPPVGRQVIVKAKL
ncbi:hypothetical protein HDU76_013294 [Blyttiomyces sp. JEL0837]|nr:hypothetical protein HDU76_013294 [Blyttiomyces sp. JEL0837]